MITYQIDKSTQHKINSEIKDLAPILAEIAPTLQTLLNIVSQHSSSISTPTINSFRDDLQDKVSEAIALTRSLTEDLHKLVSVSEQAGKHLAAIEEHFGAVLRTSNTKEVAEAAV